MNITHPTDLLHPGLRSILLNGPAALGSSTARQDDLGLVAQAIQHLAWRLAAAEGALAETHDRCSICGRWISKKAKAVRLRVHAEISTPEDPRTLAYHAACLEEQDPEQVEGIILADAERLGGDQWAPADGGPRLAAARAAMLRGLDESCALYRDTLEAARKDGHLPREWMR